jgi:hypothetical protein
MSSELCDSKDVGYLVMEYFGKNLPSFLFFYFAWVNYNAIYELSYERAYKFSCLFKTKLVTVRLMVLICFINMTVECCSYSVWRFRSVHDLIEHTESHMHKFHFLSNMVIERCIMGDDNYMKKNAEMIFYNLIYILLHLISFF